MALRYASHSSMILLGATASRRCTFHRGGMLHRKFHTGMESSVCEMVSGRRGRLADSLSVGPAEECPPEVPVRALLHPALAP